MTTQSARSNRNSVVAGSLILAMLAKVPFANGLLLHDHGDIGIHAHTVHMDDLHRGDLHIASHHHHHSHAHHHPSDRDDGFEHTEDIGSLFLWVNDPAVAMCLRCSSGSAAASTQHPASKVLPRSMRTSGLTNPKSFTPAPWGWTRTLRPNPAIETLLQTSRALLL